MGLSLENVYDSTDYQIGLYLEAYAAKRKVSQELLAWHASWVMSVHTKRPVRMQDLLGGDEEVLDARAYGSKEEFVKAIEEKRRAKREENEE